MDGIQLRGQDGKRNNLTLVAFEEQTIAALETVFELAEGSLLPCRIEDEIAAAILCRDDAMKFGRGVARGDFDGGDHMIADDRGRVGSDDAAASIDHHERGVNADTREHGGEQSCLILAVAVAVAEAVGGEVELVAADAHLDGEV